MGLDIRLFKICEPNKGSFKQASHYPELMSTFGDRLVLHQITDENKYYFHVNQLIGQAIGVKNYHCQSLVEFDETDNAIITFNGKEYRLDAAWLDLVHDTAKSNAETIIVAGWWFEQIGYQRKGANQLFYDEGRWGSKCIVKKSILKRDLKRYFHSKEPFKSNIVDKFEPKNCYVTYC